MPGKPSVALNLRIAALSVSLLSSLCYLYATSSHHPTIHGVLSAGLASALYFAISVGVSLVKQKSSGRAALTTVIMFGTDIFSLILIAMNTLYLAQLSHHQFIRDVKSDKKVVHALGMSILDISIWFSVIEMGLVIITVVLNGEAALLESKRIVNATERDYQSVSLNDFEHQAFSLE